MLIKAGYAFFVLGLISLVMGIAFAQQYSSLGVESIYMIATLFAMLGIIFYTNAKMHLEDKKAVNVPSTIFNTGALYVLEQLALPPSYRCSILYFGCS